MENMEKMNNMEKNAFDFSEQVNEIAKQGNLSEHVTSTPHFDQSREIKKILDEILTTNKEIRDNIHKLHNYFRLKSVTSLVIFVLLPLVLSIVYLPPILEGLFEAYKPLLDSVSGPGTDNTGLMEALNKAGIAVPDFLKATTTPTTTTTIK